MDPKEEQKALLDGLDFKYDNESTPSQKFSYVNEPSMNVQDSSEQSPSVNEQRRRDERQPFQANVDDTSQERDPLLRKDVRKPIVNIKVPSGITEGLVVEGRPEEPPPSYETAIGRDPKDVFSFGVDRTVTCRVCQNAISISGKTDQYVVKCSYCNEATPIQNAPPGKKYVRCPCNCLLVCKISSQRIACPRPDCKRIISLGVSPISPPLSNPGWRSVTCRHCSGSFCFDTLQNALARCPSCRKVSSVGPEFARGRATTFLIIAAVVFVCLLVLVVVTTGIHPLSTWLILLYIALFLVLTGALARSLYYFTMKVSIIEEQV